MIWLANAGYRVVGVDFSTAAIAGFFSEWVSPSEYAVEQLNTGERVWRAGDFAVVEADIFKLSATAVRCALDPASQPGFFYDRAGLTAIRHEEHEAYVAAIGRLVQPAAAGLLICVEHNGYNLAPPFSISESEVNAIFSDFRVRLLERTERPTRGYEGLGITTLSETVFALTRSSAKVVDE